jgi:hypothetical protein
MPKEKTRFDPAPEVEEIANQLIPLYHKHLIDFSVNVRYYFTNKVPKLKGKEVWGQVHKISGRNAALAENNPDGDEFFMMTIPRDIFDVLPEKKRLALVDHYLCKCWAEVKQAKNEADADVELEIEQDNPVKLSLKPYDVEEYACIVKRHGLWREEVEELVNAAIKDKTEEDDEG